MNAPLETVLRDYRARLEAIYGPRLVKLVLFGSRARGDADPDSDIYVMIVLEGPLDAATEGERTIALAAELSLRYDTVIIPLFADAETYRRNDYSFFQNVRREGLPV
jgi:uncharacterized protein